MAGINPTLAFAVLFFGMSGNPNEPTQEASIDTSGSGCPGVTVAEELSQPPAQETWSETLLSAAGMAAALPDVIEPEWSDSVSSGIKGSEPPPNASSTVQVAESDPITRNAVPASMSALDVDPGADPCRPGQ